MARERICLLECFKCGKEFELELDAGEAITSAAREARCPHCGYKPVKTRPSDVWSAVNVHKIVGTK
jgi:DNA-directed RNA polymerase subunit RPC12/RpoP